MLTKFINRAVSAALLAAIALSGCNSYAGSKTYESPDETLPEIIVSSDESDIVVTNAEVSVSEIPYEFNPHVYSAMLDATYSDDYRESFFNLCDALREGRDTFECSSKEVYDWCTNEVTLAQLFPVACVLVTNASNDGSRNYENGTGRLYYTIPAEEFVQKEMDFEEEITGIINSYVKSSYSDFEKCLALFDYMVSNYKYDYEDDWFGSGMGASYFCFLNKKGICASLSYIYAYLLMQVGVDAITVSNFGGGNAHAWTFVTVNGKGYHIDPTWGLKDEYSTDDSFGLDYFMMTDTDRENAGYLAAELEVPILPYSYASECTEYSYVADDDTYRFPMFTACTGYDTTRNVIYYSISGDAPLESQYE